MNIINRFREGTASYFRAIVFSPTRELALQTLKFTRELGRYTGQRAACVLGGESMEKQFAVMHERPDVVRYRVEKSPLFRNELSYLQRGSFL